MPTAHEGINAYSPLRNKCLQPINGGVNSLLRDNCHSPLRDVSPALPQFLYFILTPLTRVGFQERQKGPAFLQAHLEGRAGPATTQAPRSTGATFFSFVCPAVGIQAEGEDIQSHPTQAFHVSAAGQEGGTESDDVLALAVLALTEGVIRTYALIMLG